MDWIHEARQRREVEAIPKYGEILPKQDPRCFKREMIEELLDSLNYAEWAFEKGEMSFFEYCLVEDDLKRVINFFIPCEKQNKVINELRERVF